MSDKGKFQQNVRFNAINPDGLIVECETLFTFQNTDSDKSYIVYTDNKVDEEGNTLVYASAYVPADVEYNEQSGMAAISLIPIEEEGEWTMVEKLIEEANDQA